MAEVIYRAFTPDLEIRTRAKGGDGRTIFGIAVPYNKPMRIDASLVEQFARSVFNAQIRAAHRVPFARDHLPLGGTLIGRTSLLRDDTAGLYGEWHVSATATGDETLELVRDGALGDLSIGFREGSNRRLRDGTIERVTASLFEVAVVLEGAYGELAGVSGVRHAGAVASALSNLDEARQILAQLPELPTPA